MRHASDKTQVIHLSRFRQGPGRPMPARPRRPSATDVQDRTSKQLKYGLLAALVAALFLWRK
jgi:hypothetical protein